MSARRLLAAALVAATALVGLVAQPAAAATQTASVVVAPDDGGIVRKGQDLGVTVTVTNTGTDALAAGRITSSLDNAPVANTAALLSSIAHPPEEYLQGGLTLSRGVVPPLSAGASTRVRITLKSDDISSIITSQASGARRLYVRYASDSGAQRIAVSSIVRMASGTTARVGFGAVIPVLAPVGTTGVVDTATQLQLAGPGGRWNRALRAAEASPSATIALDPAVIASIRLAGDAAPPEAVGFLDELSRLPNEVIRLPYADGDVTLERAAGSSSKALEPSSFAGVTLPTAVTDGPTPAPTSTPGAVSTSSADLTEWNWSEQTVAWPVPHSAGAADLSALGRTGATVLLPSDDITDTPARRAVGPFASVGGTKVLVADATASSLLATAVTDGPRADAALATLTGLLATAAVSGEATALLATTGRAADPGRLDRVLSTLDRQSWVRGRSLSQLATGRATSVKPIARSVPAARVATARSLLAGEHEVQELGKAITTGADAVTAPQHLALLGMLSASWRSGEDAAWRTAATGVEKSFSTLTGKVGIADQSAPNLVGNDGKLSVVINNGLPEPVTVVVHAGVSNGALQFTGTSAVTVTVPAKGQNHGDLHFRSIRNGRTNLTLNLTTPNGFAIGGETTRAATVSAGFDTIIAVVLLSALGLLLALGVYRNVKRRGRPRTVTA